MLQQAGTRTETAGRSALRWLTGINRQISRLCLLLEVGGLAALVLVIT